MDDKPELALDEDARNAKDVTPEAFFKKWGEAVFYKLVALHRWSNRQYDRLDDAKSARLLPTLALLARDAGEFKRAMQKIETGTFDAGVGTPAPAVSNAEAADGWTKLWKAVAASQRLRDTFASEPLLSAADARLVATLAQFADIAPDEETQSMLGTQDAVFAEVLNLVLPPRDLTDPEQLLAEHAGKCLALIHADRAFAARLEEIARTTQHAPIVFASVEDGRDYTEGPSSDAGKLLTELRSTWDANLLSMLASAPRLTQIPPDLFKFIFDEFDGLEEAREHLPKSGVVASLAFVAAGDAALKSLDALTDPSRKKRLEDLRVAARLRVCAARALLEVRKTAKVETLRYKWPRAWRLATSNRRSIVNVENYLVERERMKDNEVFNPASDEETELYNLCETDPLFRSFLLVRPYFDKNKLFQELPAPPLSQIAKAQAAATTATQQQQQPPPVDRTQTPRSGGVAIADTQQPAPTEEKSETTQTTTQATTPTTTTPTATTQATGEYDTVNFEFVINYSSKPPADEERKTSYAVLVDAYESDFPQPTVGVSNEVSIPSSIAKEVFEAAVGPLKNDADPQPLLTRMFSQRGTEYLFRIVRAGKHLYKSFLGPLETKFDEFVATRGTSSRKFLELFAATNNSRVVIAVPPELKGLPWEWLTFPSQDRNFVLNVNHSLVRFVPKVKPEGADEDESTRPLELPLKVLTVMPSYFDNMRGEVEKRTTLLRETLGRSEVQTQALYGDDVTSDSFSNMLREFSPHVIHFEGQIGPSPPDETALPHLVLRSARRGFAQELLNLTELKQILASAGVRLMVLQNSPFFPFQTPLVFRLVEELLTDTLPAALAPVRAMDDASAVEFVHSFYGALLDGHALEPAISRARLELLSKGGDWSAYALFSDAQTLRRSPILPLVAQPGVNPFTGFPR